MSSKPTAPEPVAIVWLDVETTGIDQGVDSLLEVACLITDFNLNLLDEKGFSSTVFYSPEDVGQLKSSTSSFVVDMHTKTELWDRLSSGTPLKELDANLLSYIKALVPEPRAAHLGGNSITLDRNFINKYLPLAAEHIHYRSVDVTSISTLARQWYGLEFEKKGTHNAMNDIRESLDELRFYREKVFR